MTDEFPSPTLPADSLGEVLQRYLRYFRARIVDKLEALPAGELTRSGLPSGWTPLELLKHLTYVERRWLEWGFQGRDIGDPWGDGRDDRWHVDDTETLAVLVAAFRAQAAHSDAVIGSNELAAVGQPGPRWDGAPAPTLERILLHLVQEYARHLGQLDIVTELAGGPTGE